MEGLVKLNIVKTPSNDELGREVDVDKSNYTTTTVPSPRRRRRRTARRLVKFIVQGSHAYTIH